MEVGDLAVSMLGAGVLPSSIGYGQTHHRENGDQSGDSHPGKADAPSPWIGRNAPLHPVAELRAGGKSFPRVLDCALHLHPCKSIRRAGRAPAHMGIEGAHLLGRKLTVEISIEF